MALNKNEKDTLKEYGNVSHLENLLNVESINQNPRQLSHLLPNLSNIVFGDPLMALRMPLYEVQNETNKYLNSQLSTIDPLVIGNVDEIISDYAMKLNPKIEESGNDKIKAATNLGLNIMQLDPEEIAKLEKMTDSEKRNIVFGNRLKTKPHLTRNVAFYEDGGAATQIMAQITGEQFLKETKNANGNIVYNLNEAKFKKEFDVTRDEYKRLYAKIASIIY